MKSLEDRYFEIVGTLTFFETVRPRLPLNL